MSDPLADAIAYFEAGGDVPWCWADDGEVLMWKDGPTIAYREEVIFVLEWLHPQGWPLHFGSLVWLLGACRGQPLPSLAEKNDSATARKGSTATDEERELQMKFQRVLGKQTNEAMARVAALPAELRSSRQARAVIAEIAFARNSDWPADLEGQSRRLDILRSGRLTDAVLNHDGEPPFRGRTEYFDLPKQLARLTPELLTLRLGTGLDALPDPVPLPLPPAVGMRDVIAELRADPEHAGLARLVRDFMAALQLPRRLSEPDEMPIGGFADITNRGNPDRLLLSELAHDDLTLAVRIALNEALYLRREPPAKQPPSTLAVLLDSGVRLWGVPRVLATAAALALVAKSAAHERCLVFRASGDEIAPVDLQSKEGVVAHLGALEPHAHPGAALAAFRAQLAGEERAEAVLITHRETYADPDFQRDLARAEFGPLYLALVDREGGFTLLRHPRGGAPLCEARVSIDDLFPDDPRAAEWGPLIDRAAHPDLPLILSAKPFPFLLPVRGKVQKAILLRGGGGACVMQDRRLLMWGSAEQGARTIASELPRGTTLWLGELADATLCVVKMINGRTQLTCRIFTPLGALRHSHDWHFPDGVQRVVSGGDVLFIIRTHHAEVRDLHTGAVLATLPVLRGRSHGRYFLSHPNTWCLLAWNGQALRLEPVVFLGGIQAEEVLRVFNHSDCEGPWVLLKNGDVHAEDGRRVMRLGLLTSVARVSEDGRRLVVARVAEKNAQVVDLQRLEMTVAHAPMRDCDWLWMPPPPTRSVRVHVRRIAVLSTGEICLHSLKSGWWRIERDHYWLVLRRMDGASPAPEATREFEPMSMPGQPGFSLRVARWPDGRCAWMDDRGMLHLRCADRSIPEVTMVLSDEGLPAWSSDGRMCGSAFFTGARPASPVEELWNRIRAFSQMPFFLTSE